MSYGASFRAVLPSPLDRRAALGIARTFAARVGARACTLSVPAEPLVPLAWEALELPLDLEDDDALEARWTLAPRDEAELRWDDLDDRWMPWVRPDGLVQDDGRLAAIVLRDGEVGIELIAEVWLDHMERAEVVAWLAARAAVPMYYVDPSWWPD